MRFLKKIFRKKQNESQLGYSCSLCGKAFVENSELLTDMGGGDCWGCLSEIEAEGMGYTPEYYRENHDKIWKEICEEAIREND